MHLAPRVMAARRTSDRDVEDLPWQRSASWQPSGMIVLIAVLEAFTREDAPHEFDVLIAAIAGVLFGQNLQRVISRRRAGGSASTGNGVEGGGLRHGSFGAE